MCKLVLYYTDIKKQITSNDLLVNHLATMSTNIFHIKTHILPGQHIREYPSATLESQEEPLQLHIKQYIPRDVSRAQTGAVTVVAAHANGFIKVGISIERSADSHAF